MALFINPLVIEPSGKRKERTFCVAFRTNLAVETKQEVLEKMFHYPPFNKGVFLCLSEFASVFARHRADPVVLR